VNNSRKSNVLITGIGLVSTFGNSLDEFWTGLMKQENIPRHAESLESFCGENALGIGAELSVENNRPEGRILEMGKSAIQSALKDWGGCLSDYKRICLVVGSGLGFSDCFLYKEDIKDTPEFLSTLGDRLAAFIEEECRNVYIANACCAGAQAIGYGMDLLKLDYYDLVIAGGIDALSNIAYSGFLRLNSLDSKGCKPFDKDRKGIVTGEGAAFFVLEKQRRDSENNRKVYCELAGSGITNDAYHVVQIDKNGEEILRAMEQALEDSKLDRGCIDLIVAHGTGTLQNDIVESKIIAQFFQDKLKNMYVTAPKGAIGHTGGASGAFGLLTAIGSIHYNCIPPISNLKNVHEEFKIPLVVGRKVECKVSAAMVNTFAFGGTNVILICKRQTGSDSDG